MIPARLLFVCPTLIGYQVFLRQFSAELAARGVSVSVASNAANYPVQEAGDDVATHYQVDFPRGAHPAAHWAAARKLRQLVHAVSPDLIHAHFSSAIFTTALARRSNWPPVMGTFQGLIYPNCAGWRRAVYERIEKWSVRRLDETWVVSPSDLTLLQYLPHVHCQSTPGFGADPVRFDPRRFDAAARAAVRRELGLQEADLMLVFVGRLTKFKGFPETVRALLRLASRYPDLHLVVIGLEDSIHAHDLTPAEWAVARGHSQVHLLGWVSDVERYLAAADGLVFPSQREGMSVCIMEALSMELPVITTPARGCGDLVQDGYNGLIVRKSVEDIQRAMVRLRDADLRAILRAGARAGRHRLSRHCYFREQIGIYERFWRRHTASRDGAR
jgi:glycosyltransferase involved in cell wall biosynthesis